MPSICCVDRGYGKATQPIAGDRDAAPLQVESTSMTEAAFFAAAVKHGLEGIVSKRAASRYRSGPSKAWIKTKNVVESDFVLLWA